MKKKISPRSLVDSLILNESFQKWVLMQDSIRAKKWNAWMLKNPDKWSQIEEAKGILLSIGTNDQSFKLNRSKQKVWKEIQSTISERDRRNTMKATILLVMTILGIVSFLYTLLTVKEPDREPLVFRTEYGQVAHIQLPDSSKVTLNANSTITFIQFNDVPPSREVTLDGEAFFDVSRMNQDHGKFYVKTNSAIVEVTGTRFNVNARRNKTKVSLNEGSVKLFNLSKNSSPVIMNPGDFVELDKMQHLIIKDSVDVSIHSSWIENRWHFENTTLRDFAQQLADNYDITMIVNNEALLDRKMTGEIKSEDINLVLEAISESLDVHIARVKNKIIIDEN